MVKPIILADDVEPEIRGWRVSYFTRDRVQHWLTGADANTTTGSPDENRAFVHDTLAEAFKMSGAANERWKSHGYVFVPEQVPR